MCGPRKDIKLRLYSWNGIYSVAHHLCRTCVSHSVYVITSVQLGLQVLPISGAKKFTGEIVISLVGINSNRPKSFLAIFVSIFKTKIIGIQILILSFYLIMHFP